MDSSGMLSSIKLSALIFSKEYEEILSQLIVIGENTEEGEVLKFLKVKFLVKLSDLN